MFCDRVWVQSRRRGERMLACIMSSSILILTLLNLGLLNSTSAANTESLELLSMLEKYYCSSKPDRTVCNLASGKWCMQNSCVSICSSLNMNPCACPSFTDPCGVCCGNSTYPCRPSFEFSLFTDSGLPWKLRNQAHGCFVTPNSPDLTEMSCQVSENGKICDAKTVAGVDVPFVCYEGACMLPPCHAFNAGTVTSIAMCGCRDENRQYPVCCMDLSNQTCLPFQRWLNSPVSVGYQKAVHAKTDVLMGTVALCGDDLVMTEGRRCMSQSGGPGICVNGHCRSVCGQQKESCECPAGSATECHVCCRSQLLTNDSSDPVSICRSINDESMPFKFYRKTGELCNYSKGVCTQEGACSNMKDVGMPAANGDPQRGTSSPAFCSVADNAGRPCSNVTNEDSQYFVCSKAECTHVCGSPPRDCNCGNYSSPNDSCRLCCSNPTTGVCEMSTSRKKDGSFFYRRSGTLCVGPTGSGMCNENGECVQGLSITTSTTTTGPPRATSSVVSAQQAQQVQSAQASTLNGSICEQSNSTRRLKCGASGLCIDGQCKHVCGSIQRECRCQFLVNECLLCCQAGDTAAGAGASCMPASAYAATAAPFFQPTGTKCNGNRGKCTAEGVCVNMAVKRMTSGDVLTLWTLLMVGLRLFSM